MKKPMACAMIFAFLFVGPVHMFAMTAPQDKSDKPVLIREPERQEGEMKKPPPEEFSPEQAEKNVEIGNFYFKKRRYEAAIGRYLEAIRYKPNYLDAYKLLAKAYEKNKDLPKAISTYESYLALYPTSPSADEFKEEIKRLKSLKQKSK